MIWFKIIWCIFGFVAWLFTYHTIRKDFYMSFKIEYWKYNKWFMIALCIMIPIYIYGGLLLLLLLFNMLIFKPKSWSLYFNIKRYERKLLLKEFRNEYPKKQMRCLSIFDDISCPIKDDNEQG